LFIFDVAMGERFEDVFGEYDLDDLAGSAEEDDLSLLEWGSNGLQYTGSLVSTLPEIQDESESEDLQLLTEADAFERMVHSHWQMLPLDETLVSAIPSLLNSMSDEELLKIPAHVLTHMQRTAAQGGVQVVSPRQVTLGGIAGRVSEPRRQPDMHLVGSNASRGVAWPVAAGYLLANAWWREPLDAYPNTPAVRARTSQESVVVRTGRALDPVEMAVVKSRALIDMQRRPDIGGDAEGLAEAVAAAWGIDADLYYDISGALIEGSGNLLRYAIGPDKHYPVVHAPVQARKVISVAAMATGRDIYGEFAALDWRRLRVMSEAVFYMSARTEGHTMEDMAQVRPVGDPSASANRPGIMQFRPLPGSVWSFKPTTFRLEGVGQNRRSVGMILPERLGMILEEQLDTVKLRTTQGPAARRVTYASAMVAATTSQVREALVSGFELVRKSAAAFQAKGYTADSAVSGFVYDCMMGDRSGMAVEAVWSTRAVAETARAIGLAHVVDVRMAKQVGSRLRILTDDLRQKLVVEAERQGASLDEWWFDFSSRLPFEMRWSTESNQAWAAGIAWYLMAQPSSRWQRLSAALANETHRALASSHLASMMLPPPARLQERLAEALTVSAARLSRSYGAYYHSIADGCYLISSRMARVGDAEASLVMRAAGRAWDIRAAAAYTVGVVFEDPGGWSAGKVLGDGRETVAWIKTSPYNAYVKWLESASAAALPVEDFPRQIKGHVSSAFQGRNRALHECWGLGDVRALRYLNQPALLHRDIEKTLAEIADTLTETAALLIGSGDDDAGIGVQTESLPIGTIALSLESYRPAEGSFWDVITQLESHDAVWVADTLEELSPDVQEVLESGRYRNGEHLMHEVNAQQVKLEARGFREAVV